VPSKKDVQKRRVAAERAEQQRVEVRATRDRRRRWGTGLLVGFLALALIAPLTAGLIGGSDSDPEIEEIEAIDGPQPATLAPIPAGAASTGATECPATDGSQERTVSFEEPPPMCIDPALDYRVSLVTDLGTIVITVDPDLNAEAANVFVTMARYGVYDDMPFSLLVPEGLAESGDPLGQDIGFRVTAEPSGGVAAGDVVMFADIDGAYASAFAVASTDQMAAQLSADAVNPPVGAVTSGAEVLDAIIGSGSAPETSPLPVEDIRIARATVTEL